MKTIFEYTDYRKFLNDYYETKKKDRPTFSYQVFADKAGFKTKTYIFKIMNGEKNLSRKSIFALADAMGLKKRETEYFEALVNFNNAKSVKEREFHYNRMMALCCNLKSRKLRQDEFTYFSEWYYPAIRELAPLLNVKDNFNLLARSLDPPITQSQAKKATNLLCDLGLLKKEKNGTYSQTDKALNSGPHEKNLAIHKFQKVTMQMASHSLDRHDKEMRNISTLTVSVSRKGFEKINNEIDSFRSYLTELVDKDEPADRVYQINFQMFPLSKSNSK